MGDGITHAFIPLMPLIAYDLPPWTVPELVANMNLVTVLATFLWGALMEKYQGHGRRRLAIGGFGMSAVAVRALQRSFPIFVVAAVA